MRLCAILLSLVLVLPHPLRAESLEITTRADFLRLVEGRALTRFGVSLVLSPDGDITGRALGRRVSGRWEWKGPHFCRDFMGEGLLGYDCQTVEMRGDALRFTALKGTGETLDLRLR
jgi:hypothetical protein